MSDFREAAADRFERAADRMYNSGFLDEERSFRDAAAQIRAGLSLEETQALEQRMLTGQKPYTGGTALDVLQQHVSSPPPQLPADLARYQPLLARLLAKNRGERFESAAEIIAVAAELTAGATSETQSSAA